MSKWAEERLAEAEQEWHAARARAESARTKKAQREADADVEFWGSKMAWWANATSKGALGLALLIGAGVLLLGGSIAWARKPKKEGESVSIGEYLDLLDAEPVGYWP